MENHKENGKELEEFLAELMPDKEEIAQLHIGYLNSQLYRTEEEDK